MTTTINMVSVEMPADVATHLQWVLSGPLCCDGAPSCALCTKAVEAIDSLCSPQGWKE